MEVGITQRCQCGLAYKVRREHNPMFHLKSLSSLDNRGFRTLFATSLVVAFVNLVPPVWWANWSAEHHLYPVFEPLDGVVEFYLAGVWALLVVVALVLYGRRGLWLLVGLPFAFFFPGLVLLLITGYVQ
jgi:hypothetical protein